MELNLVYCCQDSQWSIDCWNSDCFKSATDEGKCFCCLPHFVSTSKVTLELGSKHETWRNIVFRGRRFEECLVKRYPCTDYLDYYDWDLVNWFADRYSRLIPHNDDLVTRLSMETFKDVGEKAPTVPVQLRFDESLADMQSIVNRVISGECDKRSKLTSAPRNRRARRAAARIRQELREPSPLRPRPQPPAQYPTWVFCVNNQWNRARLVEDFRADVNFKLVWFHDGNMIRIHKDEFVNGELVLIQRNKPETHPKVSEAQIISRQIYIYMCLDGFWEYVFPSCPNISPALFPYHNPVDPYDPPYGTAFAQVEDAVVQLINSGKLEMPTDVEKGDEIVSYIFDQAFDRLMTDRERDICESGYASSSSQESRPPVRRSETRKSQASRVPIKPATGQYTIDNLPFPITLESSTKPEDIRSRNSGVIGIIWTASNRWHAQVCVSCRTVASYFKPRSLDDCDVKDALELAKEHLRTVLLPLQAVHQLNSKPHGHFRFNPK